MTSRHIGSHAENIAVKHVQKQGYKIIDTNYHSAYGEIDIICLYKNRIIFIEVRYRNKTLYGNAASTVTYHKQQRIIKTASYFLMQFPKYQNLEVRFDVIGIEGSAGKQSIEWLEAAFTL